jgi:hypothetical protein
VRPDYSAATGSIAPSRVAVIGGYGQSANADPITACDNFATVSISSAGNTQIITGAAGQTVYICSINLVVSSATAVSMFEGAGSLCNTNKQGMYGGTATGTGWNLATNGGLTQGTGVGIIGKTGQTGQNVCIGNTTAAQISGGIMWTRW